MLPRKLTATLLIVTLICLACAIFYQFYFLRLPDRHVPGNPTVFVSPANGTVTSVTHWNADSLTITKGDWGAIKVLASDLGKSGTMVAIQLNLSNVHYQRAAIKGFYLNSTYTPGSFHNALTPSNEYGLRFENEHNAMMFISENGTKYKVVQIAGLVARRIVDDLKSGRQPVDQGQVVGLIRFGSEVAVLFPDNVNVTAKKGDYLIDGETIIAKEMK